MTRKLKNIATGDIYKRIETEMNFFVNVKNEDEVAEMVQADIILKIYKKPIQLSITVGKEFL